MIAAISRECRLVLLAVLASSWTAGAVSAQTHDQPVTRQSLAVVKARVPAGGVVYVTDTTGATIKGTLAALTDDAVLVKVGANLRMVAAADIRRVDWQRPDSPLTGVLIGAAVGAAPGIYWLVVDPNECYGMCPEEYAFIAIGALVGGLIDHAIQRKVTVYAPTASGGHARSVWVGPLVTRNRHGVRVAIRF